MATIRPFRALRPEPNVAAAVSAVPYDVVNTAEARALAAGDPLSFLHVSRPEIDLPDGTDPYADQVYAKARENFETLKREAPLSVELQPSLYVYRLQMGTHSQTGIAACCSMDEYDADIIKKHERTRKDKEDDRTRHMLTISAQTGPVFMTYRQRPEINQILATTKDSDPLYDFVASDEIQHTMWRVNASNVQPLVEAFQSVRSIYIADGHHRAASAARARDTLKAENSAHRGDEAYNFFLCVLFTSNEVQILPYNRIVKELNGLTPRQLLSTLEKQFEVQAGGPPSPAEKGAISMRLENEWYSLSLLSEVTKPLGPIASLDVSVLEDRILEPILGITDIRTDKRIDFVGGIRGPAELERMVADGRAAVAFSMYPVSLDELMAISDAGAIMPPKSTWFEPKLRDGLLSHLISGEE